MAGLQWMFSSKPLPRRRWCHWVVGVYLVAFLASATFGAKGATEPPEPLIVAVAANFAGVARTLGEEFTAEQGVPVQWIVGSTGLLSAQIARGLPVDLLLAADVARPRRLVQTGAAVDDSLAVYARGRLALWVPGREAPAEPRDYLAKVAALAHANPKLAPYGLAAESYLAGLNLPGTGPRIVLGQNVATSFTQVASGAVPAGLVALAQLVETRVPDREYLALPDGDYPAIEQALVLTQRGVRRKVARDFRALLLSPRVARRLEAWGYVGPYDPPISWVSGEHLKVADRDDG